MQKKKLNRIVGMIVQGRIVETTQGKVYENGKHYYYVTLEGVEHKYPKGWVSALHKANAWNYDIAVISV